jgi:hypothetical protein
MSKFKGKNTIVSAVKLFAERERFFFEGYEEFNVSPHVKDLSFGEFQMYGRIDNNMIPVLPQENFLTFISSGQEQQATVRVLDFVAEAFENVRTAFKNACLLNSIPQDDPYLSVIDPIKGYESPVEQYRQYMEEIISTFHDTYILAQGRRLEVITIDDYVNHLVKYLKILGSNLPMTFSSWQKSRNSSIFTSGIAISLAPIRIDDDDAKYEEFMSNRAFQYYLNVTKQHGFNVSRNSPWILFADLDSYKMKKFHLEPRLIISKNAVFNSRFEKAYSKDVELLDEIITRNYNFFVSVFPIEKKHNICNNNKLIYNIINRNKIESLNNSLSDSKLLTAYSMMKNIEENSPYPAADLQKIIKNGKNFTNTFDRQKGIRYINEKFRQTFKSKSGGINSIIRRNKAFEDSLLEDK